MSEPRDKPADAVAPGGDPNYILSQEEFHRAIRPLYQMHGETQGQISREAAGLRTSIGWCLIVGAIWLGYLGFLMTTQQIRGSR